MRAKTTEGNRLKRLAKKYAKAVADVAVEQVSPSQSEWDTRGALREAKEKLFAEIDRIMSVDLTPRAISGDY